MLLLKWLIYTVAIIITAYLLPGVTVTGIFAALVAALVLGFINALVRPLILLLTLPLNILTLGLLTFVINAGLVLLAAAIVPGLAIANFWWALLFALVLTIINWLLKGIVQESTQPPQPPPSITTNQ
jgi:putative membrane protein